MTADHKVESRSRASAILFATGIALVMTLLNLPTKTVDSSRVFVGQITTALPSKSRFFEREKAGFPFSYRIQLRKVATNSADSLNRQLANSTPLVIYRSWPAIIANVATGIVLMSIVVAITLCRSRCVARSPHPDRTRLRFDGAFAFSMLLIPTLIYFSSLWVAHRHLRFAGRLSGHGAAELTTELPAWLSRHLPATFHQAGRRLRRATLTRADDSMVTQTLSYRSLRALQLQDHDLRTGCLDALSQTPSLTSLILIYCQWDDAVAENIAKQDHLVSLSLAGSPMTTRQLKTLHRMRNLRALNLRRTGVDLSEIRNPQWAKSLEILSVSRPQQGKAASIKLENFERLLELHAFNLSVDVNDAVFDIQLINCPRLRSLAVDRAQLHRLTARHLPNFRNINEQSDSTLMLESYAELPGASRWQQLELVNCPNLREIEANAVDLTELHLEEMPSLSKVRISNSMQSRIDEPLEMIDSDKQLSKCIEEVVTLPNLRRFSCESVQIRKEDVQRLANCTSLRRLDLEYCDLTVHTISSLAECESLRDLSINDCVLDQEVFERLVALPNLRTLNADFSQLETLTLQQRRNLINLSGSSWSNLQRIELNRVPRLVSFGPVTNAISSLRVDQATRLDSLMIDGPWPAQALVQGIPRLATLHAEGEHFDDEQLKAFTDCVKLDQLTLIDCNLSKSAMSSLGRFQFLTKLLVPGCRVDDDVVANWNRLTRLRSVSLDRTNVSSRTFEWLTSLQSLRALNLGHLQISPRDCQVIATMKSLESLSIAHCRFDVEQLSAMIKEDYLERLDITGVPLTSKLLEAVAQTTQLRLLLVDEEQLETQAVQAMVQKTNRPLIVCEDDVPPFVWGTL